MILITGATGRTGNEVAKKLAMQGIPVRALVRNAVKAAPLAAAGIELAIGDAADASSVLNALKGVKKIAIILPNSEQQFTMEKHLTDLSVQAGVKHILKISSIEAEPDAHAATHRTHWDSEQHIRASGLTWTMVRPSFYMQNFLSNAATIKAEGKFYYPFGATGCAVLSDSSDAGAFAAHCLSTAGHENKSYNVSSADRLSFHQAAEVLSRELGRKIEYVPQDATAYKAFLGRFLTSKWHLDAVCEIFAEIEAGYVGATTNTFREIMGREPTSLAQFIQRYAQVFQP